MEPGKTRSEVLGLVRECVKCRAHRLAVATLNEVRSGLVLTGRRWDADAETGGSDPVVGVYGPFAAQCRDCQGTGLVLTDRGRSLLGFLAVFLEQGRCEDLHITDEQVERDAQIPF